MALKLLLILLCPSLALSQIVDGTIVDATIVNAVPAVDTNLVLWLLPSTVASVGNNGAISIWTDLSVWGNSPTQAGGIRPRYTNNVVGTGKSGVVFDGSTYYMVLSSASSLEITGDFTLMTWHYTGSGQNQNFIWGYDTVAPNHGYALGKNVQSPTKFDVYTDPSGRKNNTTAPGTGAWKHMAVTVSGGTARFYLGGVADGTAACAAPGAYTGVRYISGGYFCHGFLRDIRIYSRALTAAEVNAIFNANLD